MQTYHTHTHLGRVKAERVFAFVMSTAAAPLLLQKHTVASGRETERQVNNKIKQNLQTGSDEKK